MTPPWDGMVSQNGSGVQFIQASGQCDRIGGGVEKCWHCSQVEAAVNRFGKELTRWQRDHHVRFGGNTKSGESCSSFSKELSSAMSMGPV